VDRADTGDTMDSKKTQENQGFPLNPRQNLAARAQGAQKTSRQDRRRSQRVGQTDRGWFLGSTCRMAGESLKRPPAGYDPAHPFIEDIKHKNFAISTPLTNHEVTGDDFPGTGASQATRHRSFRAVLVECRRPALRCYGSHPTVKCPIFAHTLTTPFGDHPHNTNSCCEEA